MCPQTPSLSPEYSHKAGLQAVITSLPLQVRPVIQRRPRGARYNGPDHTWASMLDDAAWWDELITGLRPMSDGAKGVPARFVSVRPAAAAKASSEGWRLCLRPNICPLRDQFEKVTWCRIERRVSLPVLSLSDQRLQRRPRAKGGVFAFAPTITSSTTKLLHQLCLYYVFIPHVL